MTPSFGPSSLQEQLAAVLAEARRGEADLLEAACLAGLIQRLGQAPERFDVPVERLEAALVDAVDACIGCTADDPPEHSWDCLAALDELCAAATWLGHADRMRALVEEAAGFVRADPDTWRVHADAAAGLLRAEPPLPVDPAGALWRAVEASARALLSADEHGEAPLALKQQLGLPVVVDLLPYLQHGRRRAAAEALDLVDVPSRLLAAGEAWQLYLTVGTDGAPRLVLLGAQAEAHRDGDPVLLEPDPDEGVGCPALAGTWTIRVGEQQVCFALVDSAP